MSFLQRAKEAAEKAALEARAVADKAAVKAGDPATQAEARLRMAQAGLQAKRAAAYGRKSLTTLIERIDPGVLADLIIKATALQERANASLREKNSRYRISEIAITAAIPPQVNFSITRIDDDVDRPTGGERPSAELVDSGEVAPVLALDETAGADIAAEAEG
ncbi:MAG TPA: hypothetical protein VJZ72_11825 [Candidatus Limnocylindrales bacterium]|nr:hypothetical protein [Candidatus Limnocylindrales bacterium]